MATNKRRNGKGANALNTSSEGGSTVDRTDSSRSSASNFRGGNNGGGRQASGSGRQSSGASRGSAGRGSSNRSGSASPYALTPQLASDAGNLAFGRPLGAPIDLEREFNDGSLLPAASQVRPAMTSIPGLMVFEWMPTIGISKSTTSPVSLAGRKMYYFVRHMNSGHANYDAVDLTNYLVAVDSALYMFAYFRRIYGLLNVYSPLNRYFARAAVEALGFSFNDLQANVANLRYALNMFAAKFAALCMPAGLGYYRRHMSLSDYLISDGPTAKAQTYAFRPNGYYVWTEGNATEWYLKYTQIKRTGAPKVLEFADVISIMNEILEPILASEDFNIMSGDILKAYGPESVIGMAQVPEDYLTIPVYDETALEQIQNMTIVTMDWAYGNKTDAIDGCASFAQDFDIHQSTTKDFLVYDPAFVTTEVLTRRQLLNFYKENPSPEDVLNATRLMAMPFSIEVRPRRNSGDAAKTLGSQRCRFDALGSEIITAAWTYQLFYDPDGSNQRLVAGPVSTSNPIDFQLLPTGAALPREFTQAQLTAFAQSLTRTSFFNYHPIQYCMMRSTQAITEDGVVKPVYFEPVGTISDVGTYRAMELSDLYKLHETAVLSEFFK